MHDRADAADLTQEVFVKVFRGVGRFHGESSLRTWIYRIALHEASNQRRWWMRHKQQEVPIEQEIGDSDCGSSMKLKETLVDPGESPFEMALHEETRSRVEAALSQVSEPFRTTLILRDIEGFVYEEVAEIQGVNLGTVKSRLVRGRALLKAILEESRSAEVATAHRRFEVPQGEEAQMSNCNSIQSKFSEYLDGRLTGHEMQTIAAHIDALPGLLKSVDRSQEDAEGAGLPGPGTPAAGSPAPHSRGRQPRAGTQP